MSDQMRILKMIEDGEVTPEEGAQLLQELGSTPGKPESETTAMPILEFFLYRSHWIDIAHCDKDSLSDVSSSLLI